MTLTRIKLETVSDTASIYPTVSDAASVCPPASIAAPRVVEMINRGGGEEAEMIVRRSRKNTVGYAESSFHDDEDYRLLLCIHHPRWPMLCISCWLPWWGTDGGHEPYFGPFCQVGEDADGMTGGCKTVIDPVDWRWVPASGLLSGVVCCVVAPLRYTPCWTMKETKENKRKKKWKRKQTQIVKSLELIEKIWF